MRILFSVRKPSNVRHYESVLRELAARGHQVELARERMGDHAWPPFVLALAESLVPIGNRNAASDVGVAGLLAAAAIRGAAMNVEINLPSLAQDDDLRREARVALDGLLADLDGREPALASAVGERIG